MLLPEIIASLVIAYLIGSIPTGYIVAKKLKGIDIREHGSGNVGATNVRRVVGNKAGTFVLVFDFLKGFIPVFLIPFINDYLEVPLPEYARILIALATSLGHSRSIFLKFSGGKSAITTLGGLFALEPLTGLITAALAFAIIKIFRYVSLGSISASLMAPVIAYLLHSDISHVIFALFGGLYVVVLHRANIIRLVQGTESRI